jgi:hypothetical protein
MPRQKMPLDPNLAAEAKSIAALAFRMALLKTFMLEKSAPPAQGNPNIRTSRKPR